MSGRSKPVRAEDADGGKLRIGDDWNAMRNADGIAGIGLM